MAKRSYLVRLQRSLTFLDKRKRFGIQMLILTIGLVITQLIWTDFRFVAVIILALASYLLTAWSLTEDIQGVEWLMLFILPVSFTVSLSLFYFLLPARMVTRLSNTAVFAVGTYAILLIENIYNVAAIRSIQLLRVAQSVGLLLTLGVVFLFAIVIYALRLPFYLNVLFFLPVIFLAALQSLWSMQLSPKITKELYLFTGLITWGIAQLVCILSFWPLSNTVYALFITSTYYSLTSIVQLHLVGRFFRNTIREYLVVFFFTMVLSFLVAKWGG